MSGKCTNNLVFCICWEQEMELEKLKEQTSGQTMIQNIIMLLTLFLGKICHSDQQSCFLHLLGLFLSSSSSMSALPAQVKQSYNHSAPTHLCLAWKCYLCPVNHVWVVNLLVGHQKISNRSRFYNHCCWHICIDRSNNISKRHQLRTKNWSLYCIFVLNRIVDRR